MLDFFTEFIGTFVFLAVILLSAGNPIAIGVALTAVIYMGGHISGGNYNPAVSIMMFAKGKLCGMTTMKYIVAQLLGAMAALAFFETSKGKNPLMGYTNVLFQKVKSIL